ncbi:Cd(II)/Pb(II)-responsive transcriptional regulator [Affinibrenneria salicis]|uniref:Cd(II)/Pb(II)-responsive transcriptional regulator n=1 Tax=Affinibrenneria salicis TaxID=2590031 RepID=A0A5J5FXW6_9GAMM|nr:Cd(II)/Pb(II)-responsive transcriptional regulator [Affinibrenneria salicis]KAA8998962.1 Cd(II)/Pb(II)-responsive transcriptional regulator [Affinibrenneria salicis]
MKIGELAGQAGCLPETIRYYEREGLLPAAHRDPDNNYRRYDRSHLERLTFIRRCRALDMAHEEIRALLTARSDPNASCESINAVIDQHLIHVQNKIAELQALEQQLSELSHSCSALRTTRDCGILHELEQPGDPTVFDKAEGGSHAGALHRSIKPV